MALYDKIVINGTIEYECRFITLYNDTFEVTLNTTDCTEVINSLKDISSIELYNSEGLLMKSVTDYNTYSSVTLIKDMYITDAEIIDAVKVVFKKTSIAEKVEELDRIVNGKVSEASMSLEEYKEHKISQLGDECRNFIHEGLDIETSKGKMHFTYNYDDQFNIKTLFDSAMLVKMEVPYHSSGNVCTIFTWEDAVKIYVALEGNLLYHTTYCNALNTVIREDLSSKEEIATIKYGQEIPENRKNEMEAALNVGQDLMSTILEKCGLKAKEPEVEANGTVEDAE